MGAVFRIICLTFLLSIVSACKNDGNPVLKQEVQNIKYKLQPFDDLPAADAKYVFEKMSKIVTSLELLPSVPLPKQSYYPPRNRYRADSIIRHFTRNAAKDEVIIGLTRKDISVGKNGENDWGVMGLAFKPGRACVVSSFRLSKKNKQEQLYKVAIHELGHTRGLSHCPVKTCLMRDAEGGNPIDEETGFCERCSAHLKKHGWRLH